jgi:uncharacterized protein YdhG (YjbR/CyaY superfamily)
MSPRITADTVEGYLDAAPPDHRVVLADLRSTLLDAIPGVTEGISYGIPVFAYKGKGMLGISSAAKHCSIHVMLTPSVAAAVLDGVAEGKVSGSTLQFPPSAAPSERTVRLIADRRVAIADAG